MNSRTAIVGDFNVVLDVSLDVRRDATSLYGTVRADELASLVSDLNLCDEIREKLGLGFEFTHQQKTLAGTCSSRIDRHYLPNFGGGNWSSSIIDSIVESDHSAVSSTLEFITTPRGNDVFTVNANLIKHPAIHSQLRKIVISITREREQGKTAIACVKRLKHEVRKYLRKETRTHATKNNSEIDELKK